MPGRVERRDLAHELGARHEPREGEHGVRRELGVRAAVLDAQRTHRVVAEDFRDSGVEAQLDLRMRAHTLAIARLARERRPALEQHDFADVICKRERLLHAGVAAAETTAVVRPRSSGASQLAH